MSEKFKNATITVNQFVFDKNSVREMQVITILMPSLPKKLRFQMFLVQKKTKSTSRRFQIPSVGRALSKGFVFVTDQCGRQA